MWCIVPEPQRRPRRLGEWPSVAPPIHPDALRGLPDEPHGTTRRAYLKGLWTPSIEPEWSGTNPSSLKNFKIHEVTLTFIPRVTGFFPAPRPPTVPPIYSIYRRNIGNIHRHGILFPAWIRSSGSSCSITCAAGSCISASLHIRLRIGWCSAIAKLFCGTQRRSWQ